MKVRNNVMPEEGKVIVAANPWLYAKHFNKVGIPVVESNIVSDGTMILIDVDKLFERPSLDDR